MRVTEIHQRIADFCQACYEEGEKCENTSCHLYSFRTPDLAKNVSIEVVSDGVMLVCRDCISYQGYCHDPEGCHLADIPT